ncbi:hypothetical protein FACS1894164_18010 [Spirochaetia bacterium]|nr:hypothetical protein FACS1894164_18010 [Spirochaetia bacterium]
MCAWRRSLRVFGNIYAIIGSSAFEGLRYLFLTLTIRNCDAASLPGTLDLLESAWHQLTRDKRQPFCRSFLGTFRSVEITYNAVEQTYHPHIHVIAAVQESYFSKGNLDYVNHERLMKLWRRVLGVDYDPQVYIEAVDRNEPVGAVASSKIYSEAGGLR